MWVYSKIREQGVFFISKKEKTRRNDSTEKIEKGSGELGRFFFAQVLFPPPSLLSFPTIALLWSELMPNLKNVL